MTYDQALTTVVDAAIHEWIRQTSNRELREAIEVVMSSLEKRQREHARLEAVQL